MSFASLLHQTCTVRRRIVSGTDDYGLPEYTWGDHLVDQACRLMNTGGREIQIEKEVVIANYKLFLQVIDITEVDQVAIDSETYGVLLVQQIADSGADHHIEAFMNLVK